ncbi:hypothetical protein BASA60_009803 [Batrachochytrium salamandrivorans]|nr:hypothetical protein BASA60_009803 [Batrachochytrium salamandrivorans]
MSFTASLASLTSTFSSIVVFGTGVALINSKSGAQAAIISIAALSFLIQRTVFMTLLEVIPKLDCTIANTLTYSMLVIMRFSILGGLFMRARGHRLDPTITIVNNVSFVLSLSILTAVVSIPISHALSSSQQAIDSISRVHQQARVLSKFILIVPAHSMRPTARHFIGVVLYQQSVPVLCFAGILRLLPDAIAAIPCHHHPNDSTQYQKTQNSAHYQQQQPHSRQASALLPQIYFYPPTPPPTFSGPAQTQTHMNYWGQNRQSDYEISSSSDILSSSSKRTHLGNEGGF